MNNAIAFGLVFRKNLMPLYRFREIIYHPKAIAFLSVAIVPVLATIRAMIMSLNTNNDVLFSTAEAAEYLGFAEDTIRRYVYRGLISAEKLGNTLIVRKSECDRYKKEKRRPGRQKKD